MKTIESSSQETRASADAAAAPGKARRSAAARERAKAGQAPTQGIPAEMLVGVVVAAPQATSSGAPDGGARFEVRSGNLRLVARVASSCLLQPEPGDTVSCVRAAPDGTWITAVLLREAGAPQLLRCDGPTRWQVRGGDLRIDADALGLRTADFSLDADTANVVVQQGDVAGGQLRLAASALKLVGTTLSSVFERVQHFSHQYLRTTQGIDRVAADHVEREARQLLRLSGDHVLANGRKLVKARGGQIHLG